MGDIDNKFNYLNKIHELINKYKNSDKFKTIDKKNQRLSAALKVYNNLSDRYKIEYLKTLKIMTKSSKKSIITKI